MHVNVETQMSYIVTSERTMSPTGLFLKLAHMPKWQEVKGLRYWRLRCSLQVNLDWCSTRKQCQSD